MLLSALTFCCGVLQSVIRALRQKFPRVAILHENA